MADDKQNQLKNKSEELAEALQSFVSLMGDKNFTNLIGDVQSLKFDNERIVKPALKDIREILSRDVYAPKADVADLRADIEALKKTIETERERTRNYAIVEKVVFGLVGIVLLAVVGALVGLVVLQKG